MLSMNTVMICSKQSEALGAFYAKVLERPADVTDKDNGFSGWQIDSIYLMVLDHSEMVGKNREPGRMILNFQTKQVQEEFERVKAAGAEVIREPYQIGQGWLATLADPDGNYFQLISMTSPTDM